MSTPSFTLVVQLFLQPGMQAEYARFEQLAATLMARHGGRIAQRLVLAAGGDPTVPDEVHLVTFPDRAAFDRYRQDPALAPHAALRARAIRHTVVWMGTTAAPFTAAE